MQEDEVAADALRYIARPAHGLVLEGLSMCLDFARFLGMRLLCLRVQGELFWRCDLTLWFL